MIPCDIAGTSLFFIARGRPWNVSYDHPHFEKIKEELILSAKGANTVDEEGLIDLVEMREPLPVLPEIKEDRAEILDGKLFFKGQEIVNPWSRRVIDAVEDDGSYDSVMPVMLALQDLLQNKSPSVIKRLPEFLSQARSPFLPDGRVTAFKVVDAHYIDVNYSDYVAKVGATLIKGDEQWAPPLTVGASGYIVNGEYEFRALPENRKIVLVAFWPRHVKGWPPKSNMTKIEVEQCEVIREIDPATANDFLARNNPFLTEGP